MLGDAPTQQHVANQSSRVLEGRAVKLDGPDGILQFEMRGGDVASVANEGNQQPLNCGNQEIARAKRWFKQSLAVKRLIGSVAAEVENGFNDVGLRENSATPDFAGRGELSHRGFNVGSAYGLIEQVKHGWGGAAPEAMWE